LARTSEMQQNTLVRSFLHYFVFLDLTVFSNRNKHVSSTGRTFITVVHLQLQSPTICPVFYLDDFLFLPESCPFVCLVVYFGNHMAWMKEFVKIVKNENRKKLKNKNRKKFRFQEQTKEMYKWMVTNKLFPIRCWHSVILEKKSNIIIKSFWSNVQASLVKKRIRAIYCFANLFQRFNNTLFKNIFQIFYCNILYSFRI